MIRFAIYGLVFVAGGVVGALICREIAIGKITGPVNGAAEALLGKNTYAADSVKTAVNQFLRSN